MYGREERREDEERVVNRPTLLEMDQAPERHQADEDPFGDLLADQGGRQR
jgi:hypothetical protein